MTVTDIAPVATERHERPWNDLTREQQQRIDDLFESLASTYDAPGNTEQLGLSRLIAATAGITLTPGHTVAQCDYDFGCSAILDGFYAGGIQVSSDQLITLCSTCTITAAPRFDA